MSGTFTAADLTDLDVLTTLAEEDISVEATADGVVLNGSVRVTQADIEASNGIIHIIDAVLLPPPPTAPEPEPAPTPDPEEPTDPEDPTDPEEPEDPTEPEPEPEPEPDPET